MPEEKRTSLIPIFILIVSIFLGGFFGLGGFLGRVLLNFRIPDFNLGSPTFQAPSQSSQSAQDNSVFETTQANSWEKESTAGGDTFADVDGVPTGLFSYGGSTTWAPLRKQEAAAFRNDWPDFQLRYTSPVSAPPGSGTGIRMLLSGQIAFSQSSRPLKLEEYEEAKQRGFNLEQIPVAIDGIAIVVNPDLDIPGLTIHELKEIYTGKITNWNQVKGPNAPIIPFSRSPEAGGTPEFFVEHVLKNRALGNAVELVDDTTQGLREVAANPGSIYYASAPEVVPQCLAKPIPIARNINTSFVTPYQPPLISPEACPTQRNQLNIEAFKNGEYPLTRRLFVIVKKDGSLDQQAGEAYAQLILTEQGQQIVREAGFVHIR